MSARILQEDLDQAVDVVFETKKNLDWVVRQDPKLQAELNKLPKTGGKLSTKVVHKVLDRIKDL